MPTATYSPFNDTTYPQKSPLLDADVFAIGDSATIVNGVPSNKTCPLSLLFANFGSGTAGVRIGPGAGAANTTGSGNVCIGKNAGAGLTTGYGNCVISCPSMGDDNACCLPISDDSESVIAIGVGVLNQLSTGVEPGDIIGIGGFVLRNATTPSNFFDVIGIGSEVLEQITTAEIEDVIAIGDQPLNRATTGSIVDVIAIGDGPLLFVTDGTLTDVIAIGNAPLPSVVSGTLSDTIAIGNTAGEGITSGDHNTFIGQGTGLASASASSYRTALGAGAIATADNQVMLGAVNSSTGTAVVCNTSSSQPFTIREAGGTPGTNESYFYQNSANLNINGNGNNIVFTSSGASIAINPVISTNLVFDNSAHSVSATAAAATVNGANLLVTSAGGGIASGSTAGGNGGDTSILGGTGGAAQSGSGAGGNGGNLIVTAGAGGAGSATGFAGVGAILSLLGGNAGSDGGAGGGANGGNISLDAGISSGTGTNGEIIIGPTAVSAIAIGNGTVPVTANGLWTFAKTVTIASTAALSFNSDSSLYRVVAGVLAVGSGSTSGSGWLQNTSGRAITTSDATNATATVSNLTALSITLIAGRTYTGQFVFKCNNSQAAEGIQFDLNGGSATMTSIWAAGNIAAGGTNVTGTLISTSLSGVINWSTITGENVIVISFSLVCNAGGTFIPRFAENTSTSGTATVEIGSFAQVEDMP